MQIKVSLCVSHRILTDGVDPAHPEHLELRDGLEVWPAEHGVDALVDVLLDVELLGDLEGGLAVGLVVAVVQGEEPAAEPGILELRTK